MNNFLVLRWFEVLGSLLYAVQNRELLESYSSDPIDVASCWKCGSFYSSDPIDVAMRCIQPTAFYFEGPFLLP